MKATSISWRHFGLLFCICWACGTTVGVTMYAAGDPAFPWMYLPLALPMGAAISFVCAAVAAPLASILVIEARRHPAFVRNTRTWVLIGCVSGAAVGAFHPLVLLAAALAAATGDPVTPLFRSSALLLGVPGVVAGAIIGFLEARRRSYDASSSTLEARAS